MGTVILLSGVPLTLCIITLPNIHIPIYLTATFRSRWSIAYLHGPSGRHPYPAPMVTQKHQSCPYFWWEKQNEEKIEWNLKFKARKMCHASSVAHRYAYVCNLYGQIFACPKEQKSRGGSHHRPSSRSSHKAAVCQDPLYTGHARKHVPPFAKPFTHYNFIKMLGPASQCKMLHTRHNFRPLGKKDTGYKGTPSAPAHTHTGKDLIELQDQ